MGGRKVREREEGKSLHVAPIPMPIVDVSPAFHREDLEDGEERSEDIIVAEVSRSQVVGIRVEVSL